jgi:hypothetical protein
VYDIVLQAYYALSKAYYIGENYTQSIDICNQGLAIKDDDPVSLI